MIRRFLSVFYTELKPKNEPTIAERVQSEREDVEIALLAAHNEQERAASTVAMLTMRKQRLDGTPQVARLKGVS